MTWSAACSLDLRLAGPDGALDWMRWSDDVAAITGAGWAGVGTILMGRKTYEFAARSGGGDSEPDDSPIHDNYIFSRTMTEAPKGATLVATDPAAFVHELKRKEGHNIMVMGGGELVSVLINGGAVDEIGLNVHPLLLGGGPSFIQAINRRVGLSLIEARTLAKECVYLRYRVER